MRFLSFFWRRSSKRTRDKEEQEYVEKALSISSTSDVTSSMVLAGTEPVDVHGQASGWCNSYTPPIRELPADALYGPDPYDVNFCFPYFPQTLSNEETKIVPFIPRLHAEALFQHATQHPEDFQYMRFPIPKTLEAMLEWLEQTYRRDPANMAYAVMYREDSKDERWTFGAFIALLRANPENLTAEIATGINFREFRSMSRSIAPSALFLRYCFNTPSDKVPGLGLRRVVLTVHTNNHPAQSLAQSMGFRMESVHRWNRVAPKGKSGNGRMLRGGDPNGIPGVDEFNFVMCWDEWEMDCKKAVEFMLMKSAGASGGKRGPKSS